MWSTPPIGVGKIELHGMLRRWLPRLLSHSGADAGADTVTTGSSASLVVAKKQGGGSRQRRLVRVVRRGKTAGCGLSSALADRRPRANREPTQTEQRVPNTAGRGPCRAVFLTEPYAERMNTLCARDRSDAKLYQKRSVGVHSLRPRTFRLIRFRIAAATRSAVCARERSDTEHGTDLRLLGCRDGDRG